MNSSLPPTPSRNSHQLPSEIQALSVSLWTHNLFQLVVQISLRKSLKSGGLGFGATFRAKALGWGSMESIDFL